MHCRIYFFILTDLYLHQWGLSTSKSCSCGQKQTMSHIVDSCPLSRFEGGLQQLHTADNRAVHWLETAAKKALAKWKVLWRCWLGGRKGIRPVKKLSGGMLVWLSVWSKVQTCTQPSWCHCHSLSLASVKSRLVLPFWYRLTWVVPDKGPLNGCVYKW